MNYDTPISPTILIFYNFQNIFENISLFDGLSSNGFRFRFDPSEYFYQKGSFVKGALKQQGVIKFLSLLNKDNYKFILQPTVLTTLFQEYSVGLSFQGGKEKEEKSIG